MSMNPIATTEYIRKRYLDYLQSILVVKDNVIYEKAKEKLNESNKFLKGPYVEITPPFVAGKSINDFINLGILSKEFTKVNETLDSDRPLYLHQVEAIEKLVVEERNIVVATGTGSGKTESFLIPIIDYLMKQKENGVLTPGVRAMLLYPMNALANDQMKRLRELLKDYPEITFGRYTGETQKEKKKALELFKRTNPDVKPISNELLSREEMRESPPNILLTNYAMLEYLLLRPSDNAFFDGQYSDEWKFIVLDEAHSYKGANGAEVSLLLKRLKERVNGGQRDIIRCIATSATLGGGRKDYGAVADFASSLFDEKFTQGDIIESTRVDLNQGINNMVLRDPDFYIELDKDIDELEKDIINKEVIVSKYDLSLNKSDSICRILYEILKEDARIAAIQTQLREKPKSVSDMAEKTFNDYPIIQKQKEEVFIKVIKLAVKAKKSEKDIALIPARYHLFVRSLEGMYVAFYPNKQVFLDHRESVNITNEFSVPAFELANCQKCGQEYIVGYVDTEGYLKQTSLHMDDLNKKIVYFMLDNNEVLEEEMDLDEDESYLFESKSGKLEDWVLCTACGKIEKLNKKRNMSCCNINDTKKYIKLKRIMKNSHEVNMCPSCGSVSPAIIRRFLTSYDPATNVLATSLYEMIPPKEVITQESKFEEMEIEDFFGDYFEEQAATTEGTQKSLDMQGRKLLIFSDNRQDAAFFAAYMNNKYNLVLWRKILLRCLEEMDDDVRIDALASRMVRMADRASIFNTTFSNNDKLKVAYSYIMKEFLAVERNTGLQGIGLLNIKPVKIPTVKPYAKLNLSADEFSNFICVILDSFRYSGSVSFPTYINPTDEIFEPRNRPVYFRSQESKNIRGKTILGWLPSDVSENKRSNFIKKLLLLKGIDEKEAKAESKKILKEIYGIYKLFKEKKYFLEESYADLGVLSRLNYQMWNIEKVKESTKLFRCDKCGKVTSFNVKGVCPEFKCNGELHEISSQEDRKNEYYRSQYEDNKLIPMVAMEHTAQLTSTRASDLQNQFEKGEVNVLSCSTTFEMGVDVGQLEAIFMRNVPPEPSNYIQRAGRAGRRTESTAFVLTYARRRSHDLNYYISPDKIIAGKIQPPYIEKYNDKIIKRHIYSVILAFFFRKYPEYFENVQGFFRFKEGKSAVELLYEILNEQPKELLEAIKIIVPKELYKFFQIDEWGFIKDFCGEDGILRKVEAEMEQTLKNLEDIRQSNYEKGKNIDYIQRIINTYVTEQIISFLARKNVLPKYGFPVDVVSLDILNDCQEGKTVQLSRDLKMAISEFAPGSKIVAAGKVWTSYSVNIVTNKGWPTFEYAICPECKRLYVQESDLNSKLESYIQDTCICGCNLEVKRKFIKPEFGFSTSVEPPKETGENKPPKYFATRVTFDNFDVLDEYQKGEENQGEKIINNNYIKYRYSPRGKLVLVNQGINNKGFRICKLCGYATSVIEQKDVQHKNKFGHTCSSNYLHQVDFGHEFTSDVLEIKLPMLGSNTEELWFSVLYAILEGAASELDIVRTDIGGCLYYNTENQHTPSIILYDEVPGGAGHVKKISNNIERVLKGAYDRVAGECGCGEETSCYGCLRNYGNQIYHDKLVRGFAKQYLKNLLGKKE